MPSTNSLPPNVAVIGQAAPARRRGGSGLAALNAALRYKEASALVILIALCVFLAIADRSFLSERSLTLVARQMSFVGVASLGAMLVLSCGQLDLSVGSCMGLGGVLAAHCAVDLHMGDAAALTIALAAGALYGAFNGALVVGLRLNSLIATLGTGLMGRGAIYAMTNSMPVSGFSRGLRHLGAGYFWGLPTPVWILLALAVVMTIVMARSKFGWHIYAIGGNEEAARLSGVQVDRLKFISFTIAGLFAALGGVLLTAHLGSGEVSIGSGGCDPKWCNQAVGVVICSGDCHWRQRRVAGRWLSSRRPSRGCIRLIRKASICSACSTRRQAPGRFRRCWAT